MVALVLLLAIGLHLSGFRGGLTVFVGFGSHFAAATHPPPGALVDTSNGYDGQFFYLQAHDPLLLHSSTVSALRAAGEGFRVQRVAYPALAFLLAGGRFSAIPFALLAVNLIVVLALTAGFAIYARRRGWSTWWAVAIALMPGMLLPVLRDLSDPLAAASMLAAVLMWRSGQRWPAALALSVAVLAREVMMVVVLALAAEAAVRAWRQRAIPGAWRSAASRAWPVVVVPTVIFAGWQAYITTRYGGPVGGAPLSPPLVGIVDEVRRSMHNSWPPYAVWDLVYVLLILAAAAAALASLSRQVTITSAAASALALGALIPMMGDAWSDTRLSAPLFAVLLVDGLQRRHRSSVLISTIAAATTILIPFSIPGAF
ncbi:MAG: hypothetical protein JO156_10650 [Solirubrobacterales bacterium]|nr:hypothetical protein [Solirubrobacterales bacterium]